MTQLLNKHISQDALKGIFCFALFTQAERNVRLGNLRLVIHHVCHGSTPAITSTPTSLILTLRLWA